jgi:hypothetical protein
VGPRVTWLSEKPAWGGTFFGHGQAKEDAEWDKQQKAEELRLERTQQQTTAAQAPDPNTNSALAEALSEKTLGDLLGNLILSKNGDQNSNKSIKKEPDITRLGHGQTIY